MKITTTNEDASVATIEDAARVLVRVQPTTAAVNGVGLEPGRRWTTESATEAIAAAMAAGDWYWLDGSAYCPACVECESPAIDTADPNVQRGGTVSVCACCKTDYNA